MSTDRRLTDDLRRLLPPAKGGTLSIVQPRGALPGQRGYAAAAQQAEGGSGASETDITCADPWFVIDPEGYPTTGQQMGYPWHGWVDRLSNQTRLHLPNDTVMDYPFTPGTSWTFALDFGLPAPSRTPAQQITDDDNGWTWSQRAVLSGDTKLLYTKNLSRAWIWRDSDGDRWLVDFSQHLDGNGVNFGISERTITLTRFGVFGASPDQYELTVSLSDIGQSSPTFDNEPSQMNLTRMYDMSPDGSRAVWGIYGSDGTASSIRHFKWPTVLAPVYRTLGWVELRLSGTEAQGFSAQLVVLYDRAETLGGVVQIGAPSTSVVWWRAIIDEFTAGSCPEDDAVVTTSAYSDGGLSEDSCDLSDDHECMNDYGDDNSVTVEQSLSNRIIGVWYDGNEPIPVFLGINYSGTVVADRTTEISGEKVVTQFCAGGADTQDDRNRSTTFTYASTQEVTYTLRWGAHSHSHSFGVDGWWNVRADYWPNGTKNPAGKDNWDFQQTSETSYNITQDADLSGLLALPTSYENAVTRPVNEWHDPVNGYHLLQVANSALSPWGDMQSLDAEALLSRAFLGPYSGRILAFPTLDGPEARLFWGATTWANHVLASSWAFNDDGLVDFWATTRVLTPSGVVSTGLPKSPIRHSASWDPITGQVVWDDFENGNTGNRVCWV